MIKYEVGLCNVWWNNSTIDTRFFETLAAQSSYFENLVGGIYSDPTNFPMNNNIDSFITFKDPANRNTDVMLSMNYVVLRSYDTAESPRKYSYRYYFINQITKDSGSQYQLNITLDDIQTNYFKYKDQIAPCIISRANLNRFITGSSSDKVKFDTRPESLLYEPEEINLTKILQKSENIGFYQSEWENENIAAWCYCYLDSTVSYSVIGDSIPGSEMILQYMPLGSYKTISAAVAVIAYPLYKSNKYLYFQIPDEVSVGTKRKIDVDGFNTFTSKNNAASYYFSYKLSKVPPFWWDQNSITIDDDGNAKLNPRSTKNNKLNFNGCIGISIGNLSEARGLISGITQVIFGMESKYKLDYSFEFNKSDLKGLRNYKYDPKIYSIGKSISLMTPDGETFDYDPLKMGKTNIDIQYDEVLNPNVTSFYFRYKGDDNVGLYKTAVNDNFIGMVNSADYSLPIANSAYSNYIANNKNAFISSFIGMVNPTTISNPTALGLNAASTLGKTFLKIDELKNAPGTIKSAKLSAVLDIKANGFEYNIDYSSAVEAELKLANERMDLYGYSYNRLDKLSNVDNIRKYHNYISAEVVTINAPISNEEKKRLIDRLKEVRFWNVDSINYDNENYERWLDA